MNSGRQRVYRGYNLVPRADGKGFLLQGDASMVWPSKEYTAHCIQSAYSRETSHTFKDCTCGIYGYYRHRGITPTGRVSTRCIPYGQVYYWTEGVRSTGMIIEAILNVIYPGHITIPTWGHTWRRPSALQAPLGALAEFYNVPLVTVKVEDLPDFTPICPSPEIINKIMARGKLHL